MEPVPEIDLAELVEECRPIARKELADKIRLGRLWAKYWTQVAKEQRFKRALDFNKTDDLWMRPY
jgi:hypothetical protein